MEPIFPKVCDITAWKDENGAIIVKDGDKTWLINTEEKLFFEYSEDEITTVDYKKEYKKRHKK